MKKKLIFPIMLLFVIMSCAIALAACAPETNNYITVYTIRYVNNYDGGMTKQEVVAGESFTLEQAPSRVGYTFGGWYLGTEEDSAQFTESYQLDGDITVYAKWTKNAAESLVTYKYRNYVTYDLTVAVATGSKLEKPEDPKYDENEMYAFDGWFTDEKCTQKFDFNTAITSDITLYAGWKQDKVAVVFNYNYTGSPAPVTVLVSLTGKLDPPENPEREHYEFIGWYTSRVGGEKFDFENGELTEGLTLYAQWEQNEFIVTFVLNGGTATSELNLTPWVKKNTSAEEVGAAIAAATVREGHTFAGWYKRATVPDEATTEADRADLTSITDTTRVYAKWTVNEYTVSFDYNYADAPTAPATQTVKYNNTATSLTASRDNYIFVGWFIDAAGSEQFTFDMLIKDDITLYAKWADSSLGNTSVTVTFRYILDGSEVAYNNVQTQFAQTIADNMPADPSVTDFYFDGWYTDAQFTKEFNKYVNHIQDTTVYGKMLKKYTFEAEAVNFEGKDGQGTSSASHEEQMIFGASHVEGGDVSNGYFVRELYYNGAFLEFEITAEKEVNDAVIFLRVSSESYEFFETREKNGKTYNFLNSNDFKIAVNGKWNASGTEIIDGFVEYDGLYMPMANLEYKEDLAGHKTPFEECFIAAKVHLNEGLNRVVLIVTNNNNHGGTFHAECPIIDCMYIYSSAELTMKDYEYYKKPGVQ